MLDYLSRENASFIKRLAAFYLSFAIVTLSSAGIVAAAYYSNLLDCKLYDFKFWTISALVFLVLFFVDEFFQCITGSNIAKFFLGLRVVDQNGNKIGLVRALLRTIIAFITFLFAGLGFIAIAFNADKKGLHDLLSGTKVIDINKNTVTKVVSASFAFGVVSLGSIINTLFLIAMFIFPGFLYKGLMAISRYPCYSTQRKILKEEKDFLKIPVNNDMITAMLHVRRKDKDAIDFIDFKLDLNQEENLINIADIEKFDLELMDYEYQIDIQNSRIKQIVRAPRCLIRDSSNRDTIFKNIKFVIDNTENGSSILSQDIFELFDYNYNVMSNQLELKVYSGDREILQNDELSSSNKEYLINQLYKIRKSWRYKLKTLSPEQLEALTDSDKNLENPIKLVINSESGYVKDAILQKASENEEFNRLTEEFITSFDMLRFMPQTLRKYKKLEIHFVLVFEEMH